ncbi:acetolactate decarboxylase [Subtercola endophyticus]|uniref:acetolactate decarboxylase n=1 Tax=Subtercola endophyticus TaxID=2895559 RepID=UPI001E5948EC|nr:acetolactate decarboxylase [Subtercola endophyticus]UFS60784.1 acetolactate decarboxylase [Subtercola endophyticus]
MTPAWQRRVGAPHVSEVSATDRAAVTAALKPTIAVNITQFSVIHALMAGLYDGVFPAPQVLEKGDFGIGCGHALNGELVFVDGEIYRCTSDGSVTLADDSELIPFAEVAKFAPTVSVPIDGTRDGPLGRDDLEALVSSFFPSPNLFFALRIDGAFDRMLVREPIRQHHPFRPLVEVMQTQNESELGPTTGSMIGFWAPQIYQGVTVAGFHFHYLDDARAVGGHCLDYSISSATLTMQALSSITLRLPQTPEFLTADFAQADADLAIRRVESSAVGVASAPQ